MMTRRTFVLAASVLAGFAEEDPPAPVGQDVSGWTQTEPPRYPSKRWYAVNRSQRDWQVAVERGRVIAWPYRRRDEEDITGSDGYEVAHFSVYPLPRVGKPPVIRPGRCRVSRRWMVPVEDGYLLSRNHGEWGADLWWISTHGDAVNRVGELWIGQFLATDHGLFATEGLAHMGDDRGQLMHLSRGGDGRWTARHVADLSSASDTAALEKGGRSVLIVTND